jgi:hypothetical protein
MHHIVQRVSGLLRCFAIAFDMSLNAATAFCTEYACCRDADYTELYCYSSRATFAAY